MGIFFHFLVVIYIFFFWTACHSNVGPSWLILNPLRVLSFLFFISSLYLLSEILFNFIFPV
jgi:hypothetical protein